MNTVQPVFTSDIRFVQIRIAATGENRCNDTMTAEIGHIRSGRIISFRSCIRVLPDGRRIHGLPCLQGIAVTHCRTIHRHRQYSGYHRFNRNLVLTYETLRSAAPAHRTGTFIFDNKSSPRNTMNRCRRPHNTPPARRCARGCPYNSRRHCPRSTTGGTPPFDR